MKRKIKQRLQIYFLVNVVLLFIIGCNTNDEVISTKENIEEKFIEFDIVEKGFENTSDTYTRTMQQVTRQTDTVDLGNGIEAAIVIEPASGTNKSITRTVITPTHYTIRAYQNNILKGEIKGIFDGVNFISDSSSNERMRLKSGSYDFICFNDKVTPLPTGELQISHANAATARIGIEKNVMVGTEKMTISIHPKHVGACVQTKLIAFIPIPTDITSILGTVTSSSIPTTSVYDLTTEEYLSTYGSVPNFSCSYPSADTPITQERRTFYTTTSNEMQYFLPATDASKLTLQFTGGTLYKKAMAGSLAQAFYFNNPLTFEANHAYTITLKLYYKFKYLFSDGSTGTLKANPTKEPIAAVIDETNRIAIALKDAGGGAKYPFYKDYDESPFQESHFESYSQVSQDVNGYSWTWDPHSEGVHTPKVIKTANSTDFPAFYQAGYYAPGVTVTGVNIGRWYVPAIGEWIKAFKAFGSYDDSNIIHAGDISWDGLSLANAVFMQAGGEQLKSDYISSSTASQFTWYTYLSETTVGIGSYFPEVPRFVRSFVKY